MIKIFHYKNMKLDLYLINLSIIIFYDSLLQENVNLKVKYHFKQVGDSVYIVFEC